MIPDEPNVKVGLPASQVGLAGKSCSDGIAEQLTTRRQRTMRTEHVEFGPRVSDTLHYTHGLSSILAAIKPL